MRQDLDLTDVFDPVAEVINKQLGSIWKQELFQRRKSPDNWKYMYVKESPSAPYSYEDELNHAIDLKYGGHFKLVLAYQYLYMGYKIVEVARKAGVHRKSVENWVRILKRDKDLREVLVKIIRGE